MSQYQPEWHGRQSKEHGCVAAKQAWVMAGELAVSRPGPGEWVPKRAIWVREEVNPRTDANVDPELVKAYASVFFDLPPIKVQRDTFVLIDGNHRLEAAFIDSALAECIRIVEVDISDEELREAAFRANAEHGRMLTTKERVRYLRFLLEKYGDSKSLADYARESGLNRSTVIEHRDKLRPVQSADSRNPTSKPHQQTTGLDGKQYERRPSNAEIRQSRTPVTRAPERDDSSRFSDEWEASIEEDAGVAQWTEQGTPKAQAEGSNPSPGTTDDGWGEAAPEQNAPAGPSPTSPAEQSAPVANGATGLDSGTSRANRDGGRAEHDPAWFDETWTWIAGIARLAEQGRTPRQFLESMESTAPKMLVDFEPELVLALRWLRECQEELVFA